MVTGRMIAKLRIEAGMTQSQLADALYVSRDLVSKWETGKRLPNRQMINAMAMIFSADPEEMTEKDTLLLSDLAALFPEECTADTETLNQILNAFLSTINKRDASVFVRRYYFLESPSDIGNMYGISENYVRTILMRTRRKLKKYLEKQL